MAESIYELIDECAGYALWKSDDGNWTVTGISESNHQVHSAVPGAHPNGTRRGDGNPGSFAVEYVAPCDSESYARRILRGLVAEDEEDDYAALS